MKTRLALLSLLACALVALMFTAAPVPRAAAFVEEHNHDLCHYTREHYGDDEDFQMWEQICEDTVRELHSRFATANAICGSLARNTGREVDRFCRRHCQWCAEDDVERGAQGDRRCRGIPPRARHIARKGLNKVSKCAWDAQKDYDAIYENARQQLEDAGYNCLVQKLYTKYRYVQRSTIQAERRTYAFINGAVQKCLCHSFPPR